MLAETDVINMVSRGISAPNILKGIHLSMAGRLSKLLKSIGATDGAVMVTGGLALDNGLVAALDEDIATMKDMKARSAAIRIRSMPARSAPRCGAPSGTISSPRSAPCRGGLRSEGDNAWP